MGRAVRTILSVAVIAAACAGACQQIVGIHDTRSDGTGGQGGRSSSGGGGTPAVGSGGILGAGGHGPGGTGGGRGGTAGGAVGGGSGGEVAGGPGGVAGEGTDGANHGSGGSPPATGGNSSSVSGSGGAKTGGAGTGDAGSGGAGGMRGSGGAPANGGASGCVQDTTQCAGTSAMQSCMGGKWGPTTACGAHQACSGTKCACVADASCAVAGPTCVDGTLVMCAQDGQGCFYPASSLKCMGGCSGAAGQAACQCTPDPACTAVGPFCASSSKLGTCAQSGSCLYQPNSPVACPLATVCERVAPASCGDPTWAQWPVPPSVSPTNYRDNGDQTITDTVTGLMWQQAASTSAMVWSATGPYCASQATGGHADWRVPTKIELSSLFDYGRTGKVFNSAVFSGPGDYYWTSTVMASISGNAWTVNFSSGSVYQYAMSMTYYVRCVR